MPRVGGGQGGAAATEDVPLAGYREVAVASVTDALDRVLKAPGYMSSAIKAIAPARIAGPAVTVLERESMESAPPVHALQAIDQAEAGSIVVIGTVEGPGAHGEVAFWGGLMTAGAQASGVAGAVVDAGVRDVDEAREAGFPVFARSTVPSTTVGRYVTVDHGVSVVCGGVRVEPDDIVVGDGDGVAVVPRARAAEVLEIAREIEATEREMTAAIAEEGSIVKAFERFGRI